MYSPLYKLSQYADDTSLALDGSPDSLFAALDTIEFFSSFSGLRINTSKTKIVWIGSKKFSDQVFHHTRWKRDWGSTTFNLLGINFSVDLEEIENINFGLQIPKIVALIEQWKRRILTPIGRVTVIKTLLIPKLNHLFISLPTPKKETISYLVKILFEFLWKSSVDKVKRSVITQDYLSGGIKMVDINNFIVSLKCSWIKRLTKSDCHKPWINIFFAMYGNDILMKLYDFGDNFIEECFLNENNAFWKDVFNAWFLYLKKSQDLPYVKNNFQNIPVWYNSNIKISGKPVFIKEWYEKGIKIVQDFFDSDCNVLTLEKFQRLYNLQGVCVMKYNSIISAMSTYLRSISIDRHSIKQNINPCMPVFFEPVLLHEKCSKIIYNILNEKEDIPTSMGKLKTELSPYGVDDIYLYFMCYNPNIVE